MFFIILFISQVLNFEVRIEITNLNRGRMRFFFSFFLILLWNIFIGLVREEVRNIFSLGNIEEHSCPERYFSRYVIESRKSCENLSSMILDSSNGSNVFIVLVTISFVGVCHVEFPTGQRNLCDCILFLTPRLQIRAIYLYVCMYRVAQIIHERICFV